MQGVNNDLVQCAVNALRNSVLFDFTIPWMGGVRTAPEQNKIFMSGNSTCDGYQKKSYHQSGNALDVIPYNVNIVDQAGAFRYFAKLMFREWQRGLKDGEYEGILEWGGNWTSFEDKPHWQVIV